MEKVWNFQKFAWLWYASKPSVLGGKKGLYIFHLAPFLTLCSQWFGTNSPCSFIRIFSHNTPTSLIRYFLRSTHLRNNPIFEFWYSWDGWRGCGAPLKKTGRPHPLGRAVCRPTQTEWGILCRGESHKQSQITPFPTPFFVNLVSHICKVLLSTTPKFNSPPKSRSDQYHTVQN